MKMKRVFRMSILFVTVVAVFVSCSDKHENTVANLKVAIAGEIDASATYLAFSKKATEEGYRYIANMLNAVAAAEGIHARNHNDVLKKLGEPVFMPTAATSTVSGTVENIQAAVDSEKNEYTVTYPGFIATAKKEKSNDAVRTFTLANAAEKNHETHFSEALSILKETGSDEGVSSKWFVCEQCGGMFKAHFARCSLCKADTERQYFIPREFDANR